MCVNVYDCLVPAFVQYMCKCVCVSVREVVYLLSL